MSSLKVATESWKEKKPLHRPVKSNKSGKKGQVYVLDKNGKKRLLHFGDSSMEDFTQHKDKDRRKNYLARSAGIKDKDGNLTKNNKNKANFYSRKYLWDA
tara:strand:+ start:354 stop:653 length:300 start_codon:yes stop_codon:yes gene_type:complete